MRAWIRLSLASLLVGTLFSACGNKTQQVDNTVGTYACDVVTAADHKCRETSYSGCGMDCENFHNETIKMWADRCADPMVMGTTVDKCTREKLIGGCQTSAILGVTYFIDTFWFYTGRASDLQTACTMSPGGMWVPP